MALGNGCDVRQARKADLSAVIPLLYTAESRSPASAASFSSAALSDRTLTQASPLDVAKPAPRYARPLPHRFNPTSLYHVQAASHLRASGPTVVAGATHPRIYRALRGRGRVGAWLLQQRRAPPRGGRVEHARLQHHPSQQASQGRADQPLAGCDGRRRQAL